MYYHHSSPFFDVVPGVLQVSDASQYGEVLQREHITLGVQDRSAAIWHAVTAAAASVAGLVGLIL